MKNVIKLSIIMVLSFMSCKKDEALTTIEPIIVIKNIVCQDIALEFKFEQVLDESKPESNSLKLTITNFSNISNTFISSSTPLVYCVNFFKENTAVLENLIALHSQTITSLAIGESINVEISKNFIHEITDKRIQIDIIECKTLKNNFAGIYQGIVLIPKYKGGNHDTIPALSRCIISAEGKVKIWLEEQESHTKFITRTILGNITDIGMFSGTSYDVKEDLIDYMGINNTHIQPPGSLGDLGMKLHFSTPQIIYNSDTCTNLIFNLIEI